MYSQNYLSKEGQHLHYVQQDHSARQNKIHIYFNKHIRLTHNGKNGTPSSERILNTMRYTGNNVMVAILTL